MLTENQKLEFKQEYVSAIKKEVIAFANSDGGTILIGVRKDGFVVGLDNADEVMLMSASALKDAIAPDVMPFVDIRSNEIEGKTVVEIEVATGTNRPYYLKEKGLRPAGVYVRKGSSSQPVTDEGIRQMIIEDSSISFEERRSIRQDLTFNVLTAYFKKKNMEIGHAQMQTLGIVGEDGLYTNLALLLSDQCDSTTKVAIFQGSDNEIFRERQEFGGSLIEQMENVYKFLQLNNKTKASFEGLYRIDSRDYPEEAVREALLNCIVHRDYSFSGSNIINIYDDRMEFVSLGGLVSGIDLASIYLGASQSRNPNLAGIFYRLKLIESYGTGIGKIRKSYKMKARSPKFEVASGAFRVALPNCNEINDSYEGLFVRERPVPLYCDEASMILAFAKRNGYITRKETEELIKSGTTKAFTLLKKLCDEGKLVQEGSGRLSRYIIP